MRWQRLVAVFAAVATLGVATASGIGAREVPDTGSLALVPRLGSVPPPTFVGADSAGRLVGVSFVSETEVVAYVCDGEDTGVWFSGSFTEGASSVTLAGRKGATLTLDLTSDPLTGTVKIGSDEAAFTLAPAHGSAGLYRERHGKQLSGWIIDNSGAIYGLTEDGGGKVVDAVQQGTPSDPPAGSGAPAAAPPDPVPAGFVACAIGQFRLEREFRKLARGGSSAGSAAQAEDARNAACQP